MEMARCSIRATFLLAIVIMASTVAPASGQISTACAVSLITSFTPCMNFITGSSNGGGSPTADCCSALASLISSSTDCACLILTGSVPFSLPINRTLAVTLPRACNSMAVPLKCKGTATSLPPPGPVAYGPSLPPLSPSAGSDTPSGGSGGVSPSLSPSSLSPPEPGSPPPIELSPPSITDNPTDQGQRPLVLPSSGMKLSHVYLPSLVPVLALGTMLLII